MLVGCDGCISKHVTLKVKFITFKVDHLHFLPGVFNPVILHPNVFPSGKVSLSLIDKNKGWKPQITTKEVTIAKFLMSVVKLWKHKVACSELRLNPFRYSLVFSFY